MKNQNDNRKEQDILPNEFNSLFEAAEFWDNNDSTNYENMMEFIDFEINIKRRICMVPIADEILEGLRKKAIYQGLSTETLVNLLLQKHAL